MNRWSARTTGATYAGTLAAKHEMSFGTPLVVAPLLAAVIGAMVMASQMFGNNYAETLCRMESARTHALQNIERNEPLEVNFGGDECASQALPAGEGGQESPTPTPAATPMPLEAQLSEALLTLEDMPTGWTTGPPVAAGGAGDLTLCGVEPQASPSAQVRVGFQQSEIGPFVEQTVYAFPQGEATQAMAEALAASESCSEWTETNEDGTQTTWRASLMAFPDVGDETLALRVSAEAPILGTLTMDLVYVRRGDLVTGVAHSTWGFAVDSEQTEAFVRRADEKLAGLP